MKLLRYSGILFGICGALIFSGLADAQPLKIDGIRCLGGDLSASVYPRNDFTGKKCALVKVALPVSGAEFEGNVIGSVEYKAGEYWVYMSAGSKFLKVKHESHHPLMIHFDDTNIGSVESNRTYLVKVSGGKVSGISGGIPVTFKITPRDAILSVDQQEYETVNGVVEIPLSASEHNYMVVAPGYKGQGNKFMVYEGNTNKIIVELDPKTSSAAITENWINKPEEKTGGYEEARQRREILKWVEDYRLAYIEKNINRLRDAFSEGTRIITQSQNINSSLYKTKSQAKRDYLESIERLFRNAKRINVEFDHISVMKHGAKPNIYGVTLHQRIQSSEYSDDGWLFLILDCRDSENPQILVRTWQDESAVANYGIFTFDDFDMD